MKITLIKMTEIQQLSQDLYYVSNQLNILLKETF